MRSRRRIDFILYSPALSLIDASASDELDLGSDHRMIRASMEFIRPTSRMQRRKRNMKGWKPHLDDDGKPNRYHE